ncbi:MAG: class I adenylate-forming enzyme family protein [Acidimicrobiales bacterium]
MSNPWSPARRLVPTYEHTLAPTWSAPDGPWPNHTLDDVLTAESGDAHRTGRPSEARVAAVAGGLAALGVGVGDSVAWQKPNGIDTIAMYRAAWRLGAVAAPVHHLAGAADLAASLHRLRPSAFVAMDDDLPTGDAVPVGSFPVPPSALAVALGSSGSTGTPKLALHTHRALLYKARLMATVHGLTPNDCILMPSPMSHIAGLFNGVLAPVSGMRVIPMARWEPNEALRLIAAERVTFMIGPPTFFVSLLDAPDFTPEAVASLRLISLGGAGITPTFVREASAQLSARVKRTYGSTEAPAVATSTAEDDEQVAAETDGRVLGMAELRVVDPATCIDRAAGEPGELLVRGPELFEGYDDPAETTLAFTDDGWFHTGDLATLEAEGWLTIVGRIKDVIIRGGENIATAELEAVLEAHPDIRQAVAVGYPDERLGERVAAFVVASAPFDLDACRTWFQERGVTKFKWPERIEQVDDLPLLPAGKPDRVALRARLRC